MAPDVTSLCLNMHCISLCDVISRPGAGICHQSIFATGRSYQRFITALKNDDAARHTDQLYGDVFDAVCWAGRARLPSGALCLARFVLPNCVRQASWRRPLMHYATQKCLCNTNKVPAPAVQSRVYWKRRLVLSCLRCWGFSAFDKLAFCACASKASTLSVLTNISPAISDGIYICVTTRI